MKQSDRNGFQLKRNKKLAYSQFLWFLLRAGSASHNSRPEWSGLHGMRLSTSEPSIV